MSLLDVCNRALSRIGVARIVALNESSAAARAMSACFPSVPDSVLASWVWSFAIWREELYYAEQRLVDSGGDGVFLWAYELPADCLAVAPEAGMKIGAAVDGGNGGLWARVEGGWLLTEQGPPLNLRYVAQVTDASAWDPAFCEVLAWRLAQEVQPELAPGFAVAQLASGLAAALRSARRCGAIEGPSGLMGAVGVEDGRWLVSRL